MTGERPSPEDDPTPLPRAGDDTPPIDRVRPAPGNGPSDPTGTTPTPPAGADLGTWKPPTRTKTRDTVPRPDPTPFSQGGGTTPARPTDFGLLAGDELSTEPVPGRTIFGKYRVVRKLGQGGMGQVWQVRHLGLDVDRALKLIISRDGFNRGGLEKVDSEGEVRFRREARVMVRFSHPNAVTVHDAGIRPDGGTAYIEMEYVPGQSLDKVIRKGVPLPPDKVVRILDQLCSVLEVAHRHGIVHRDLKPPNLILVEGAAEGREQLKVFDFGIAKILGAEGNESVTNTGLPIGTPAYMSPEQILGISEKVDGRSDLYSVGVMLYEFLTGYRPFEGPVMRVTSDHLTTPPPPFASKNPAAKVPAAVERLVLRCLEKEPDRRPGSAAELAALFRAAVDPASVPGSPANGPPARRRHRRQWLAAAVAGLAAASAGLALWLRPAPLAVRVMPESLTLLAGESKEILVKLDHARGPRPAVLAAVGAPPGVDVAPVGDRSAEGVQVFRVAVPLDSATAGAGAGNVARFAFAVSSGGSRASAPFTLTVNPPVVRLPAGFRAEPGAKLVAIKTGVYPARIARDFADGPPAVFLLVEHRHPDDPDPFYILRDKVWAGLFRKFAAARPGAVKADPPRGGTAAPAPPTPAADLLPVFNVTYAEADAFARWLAGGPRGRIPSARQWDTAAGVRDRKGRRGPFLGDPSPGGIAVDRKALGPLPVGAAARDVSPLGCRDMAGNGNEWTRPEGTPDLIELRGRSYELPGPLLYDEIGPLSETARHRDRLPDLGFRTVMELDDPD